MKIWSEGALLLTYTLPYFIILLTGIFIGEKISRLKNITWQTRLLLNWISLNLIVFFISNLLKAIFYYRDFGVALHWVLESVYLRMAVVFLISALLVLYCKRFQYNFLKTAPGKVFLLSASLKRSWLLYILVLPVFPGIFYAGLIWWPAMRLNMLLTCVVFMIIFSLIMSSVGYLHDSRIYKSKKTVPSLAFTISALSILWVIFKLLAGYSFAFN
ncbi:MAG: hypothetical protein HGA37_03760 [Lentimicrobium sp.]|nr:hypothetical protein [Lentimicrobium sp.]